MNAHPIASLFPMMTDGELADLATDIAAHGLNEPIITHEGQILDGRNRYEACRRAGVTAHYREWEGEGGSPIHYVASANLHRRHLTTSQRAAIAVEIADAIRPQVLAAKRERDRLPNAERQRRAAHDQNRSSAPGADGAAAQLLNVSRSSVIDARRVRKEEPELFEAVKRGEVPVTRAHDAVRGPRPASFDEITKQRAQRRSVSQKLIDALLLITSVRTYGHTWRDSLENVTPGEADKIIYHIDANTAFLAEVRQVVEPRRERVALTRQSQQ